MIQLDRLNMSIISQLQDGRKSYGKIAAHLGVAENTVKARVRRLESDGILKIAGFVNPEAMEGHQIVYIGIKLKGMTHLPKGEEISRLRRVVSVGVVTGRYDLLLTVHLKQGFGFLEFLSEELGRVEGIKSIESFMVYKGFEIKVPYITGESDMPIEASPDPNTSSNTNRGRRMTPKYTPAPEGIAVPEILVPGGDSDPRRWAVIACDQFSSEPSYWEEVRRIVDGAPSALDLIIPEYLLIEDESAGGAAGLGEAAESRVEGTWKAMRDYLERGLLRGLPPGFISVNRRTPQAPKRRGLVLAVDLEAYDFAENSSSLIRPTEGTIRSRLPARMDVRRGAALDIPHILLLIDDPRDGVMSAAEGVSDSGTLYDFELMQGGGHITGRFIPEEALGPVFEAFEGLSAGRGLLFAVGDGNHSLAAAREIWLEKKAAGADSNHPARFALAEVENIHDPGLHFHPIHRLLFGVNPDHLIAYLEKEIQFTENPEGALTIVTPRGESRGDCPVPPGRLAVEPLQDALDSYLEGNPGVEIDYIHGASAVRQLVAASADRAGLLLPDIDKSSFFRRILEVGPYPRKTFSIGEAVEKRYYLEARRLEPSA